MTAFFISIILIGILVVCIAFILVAYDRKKAHDYRLDTDERKHDLMEVISDAEQLLTELNKFSDYIVSEMEQRHGSLEQSIVKADEKLDLLNRIVLEDTSVQNIGITSKEDIISISDKGNEEAVATLEDVSNCRSYKVIPLNEKRREVIKLSNKGMDSTEIARVLNMGKGEIELIHRMCQ